MKSSDGKYFIALDHVRAIAAFLVFVWHFIHIGNGQYANAPIFPLSIFTEGHIGVSMFMTLSGYLFAKLLDGRLIDFSRFLWNRLLRLAPLLLILFFIEGIIQYLNGINPLLFIQLLVLGIIQPLWPNGGWSITVEMHFYILLPFLLACSKKTSIWLLFFLLISITLRWVLFMQNGSIQGISYFTIIGRVDQFLLGILAWKHRSLLNKNHIFAVITATLFLLALYYFDTVGGFYNNGSFPSASPNWIIIPTVEGAAFAILTSWYDNSFKHSSGMASQALAKIGRYSYSIYLLHFFYVFHAAKFIDENIISLSNIYMAIAIAPLAFIALLPVAYASYTYIEMPFLKTRKRYIVRSSNSN